MKLSEAIELIRPSVVQIVSAEGRRAPLGTGFIVDEEAHVVTAHHVVASARQILVGLALPNTENMRGNFILVDVDLVAVDGRHDLGLLKLRRNPFRGAIRSGIVINNEEVPVLYGTARLNPNRPKDGFEVGISGYPLHVPVMVTNSGWMATSWESDIAQMPAPGAPPGFAIPDIADSYLADVEVNPGNSGGPGYLVDDASVIGVCVGSRLAPVRDQAGNSVRWNGGLFYSSGLTAVVPARYVVELLKRNAGAP